MMEIRKPKKSDIEGLKRLSANFADEYEWGDKIPIGQIDTAKKAEERLFGDDIEEVLVAVDKERLIGYIAVNGYEYEGEKGYEASILIDKDYRGQGLGRIMTDKIFSKMPVEIEAEAWVADFNQASLKATPKMGFELEDKFLEDEFIPGRKYHVYVFTRSGEKSSK